MFIGLQRSHSIFMWSIMSFILHHMNKPSTEQEMPIGYQAKSTLMEQGQFDPGSGNAGSIIHLLFTNATTRIPFIIMMVLALPSIVKFEEEYFRNDTDNWFEGIIRSILFGMVHFLLGFVPLGAALALSLAGIILTEVYMTRGLDAAVTQHLAYDSLIVLPLAIGVLLSPLVSMVSQRMRPEALEA
jgi:membrane protease YdiL (CAAX protease family)